MIDHLCYSRFLNGKSFNGSCEYCLLREIWLLSLGITSFCHIGSISRGGPGITAITLSFFSTHQPGAVPFGLGKDRQMGYALPVEYYDGGISLPHSVKIRSVDSFRE